MYLCISSWLRNYDFFFIIVANTLGLSSICLGFKVVRNALEEGYIDSMASFFFTTSSYYTFSWNFLFLFWLWEFSFFKVLADFSWIFDGFCSIIFIFFWFSSELMNFEALVPTSPTRWTKFYLFLILWLVNDHLFTRCLHSLEFWKSEREAADPVNLNLFWWL